jgi:nucleotide-binding universal stress UspA family protein
MGRYRKILVAVDGSEPSLHALREACRLSSFEKCWITVVSVAMYLLQHSAQVNYAGFEV